MIDPRLIVTNIAFTASALAAASFAILSLAQGPKKQVNLTFGLMNFFIAGFEVAYLVGINATDPGIARGAFAFTSLIILVVALNVHNTAVLLGILKRQLPAILSFYAGAVGLCIFILATLGSREIFFGEPTGKLYFPHYLAPGAYYWTILLFSAAGVVYILANLFHAYLYDRAHTRKSTAYIIASIAMAYGFGSLIFAAGYLPDFDPLLAIFFGLYVFPLAYTVLRYEIFFVRMATHRALFYAIAVIASSLVIGSVSISNNLFTQNIPGFPVWVMPLVVSIIAVGIGSYVWKKIREVDILKAEFINIITHKFRGPMTHINWSLHILGDPKKSQEEKTAALEEIRRANTKFDEFTNLLTGISLTEEAEYLYQLEKTDSGDIAKNAELFLRSRAENKNISVRADIPPALPAVLVDKNKLQSALQVLFENAVNYTLAGGIIRLAITRDQKHVTLRIQDSGIGISEKDKPFLFTKFFRSAAARAVDTEGMGIGLFMAKTIVERHGGSVWAESGGENKGASFFVKLPIAA